jgi:predicted ester cyclase
MTGTNSGPMGGMPASNKPVSVDGIDIIVVKDGKAVERWGIFDNMKMMQDMGMMPQQGMMKDTTK